MSIPESDWKKVRRLKDLALERYCGRVLSDCERIARSEEGTSHQRYLELYKLIEKRDKVLARTFDRLSRSTATDRLASMYHHGLITDEEFADFTEETQRQVRGIIDFVTG